MAQHSVGTTTLHIVSTNRLIVFHNAKTRSTISHHIRNVCTCFNRRLILSAPCAPMLFPGIIVQQQQQHTKSTHKQTYTHLLTCTHHPSNIIHTCTPNPCIHTHYNTHQTDLVASTESNVPVRVPAPSHPPHRCDSLVSSCNNAHTQ